MHVCALAPGRVLVLAASCAVFLSSCGGCASQSATPKAAEGASLSERLPQGEVLAVDERYVLEDGAEDVTNHYAFAVMVSALMEGGETLKCTGVLVSPRLILTAGHCVCARRKLAGSEGAAFIIDGSACAGEVFVTTVTYRKHEKDSERLPGMTLETFRGEIKVHPGLRVLLDAHSLVVESNADLAAAFLDKPIEGPPLPVRFSDAETKEGEIILMAGYGYDAVNDLILGVRRFGQKRITQTPAAGGDTVMFHAYGRAFTSGSGEPCLRQEKEGVFLVGISSKGLGETPAFTSIHAHRDWLDAEVRRAEKESPSGAREAE